ncbi:hypothetical protein BDB00DRAFT_872275 [Zychaea mexicana]|uniref:uncharacterized protein n=1 Tax=Zychaea mexicana TaxID=64656 RepID=UPI0022FE3AAE|nr:uncharacterized protein BDB00DRAFT_872275 [Zychaea mexicana]KAI9493604.1 hypothetical protein BDB00DRAFT_872275 [Zychaea mexicana]
MFGGGKRTSGQQKQQFDFADLDDLLNGPLPEQSHDDGDDTDLNDPELLRQLQELTSSSPSGSNSAQKAKAAAQKAKVVAEQKQRRRQIEEQKKQSGDIENLDLDSYAALAQGNDDDPDVELNEDDLNDPTLLKELSVLSKDSGGQGPSVDDDHVMEQQKQAPSESASQLMSMGFSQQQAEEALDKYDGNIERATNHLLDAPAPEPAQDAEPVKKAAPVRDMEPMQAMESAKVKSSSNTATTLETVQDEDDDMDLQPQPVEEQEPDIEELQRQSKQYQQQALAAKRQGDKKKAVELLRKSKALAQKYSELSEIQQAMEPHKAEDPMEDVQRTPPLASEEGTKQDDIKINDDELTTSQPVATDTKAISSTSPFSSPSSSPSPSPSSQQPAAAVQIKSAVDARQLLQEIVQLQKEHKEAAHHYKDLGNLAAAKEMVKVSKELLRVGIQVKNGEATDMDNIRRKLPSKPNMTLGDGKIRQIQQVETAGPAATVEHLESQLTYQIDVCHNLAVQTSASASSNANTAKRQARKTLSGSNQAHFQQLEQAFTADLVSLRSRRDQNQKTTPHLHYEQVEYSYKNILDHIPSNQMELRIVRGIGLQSLDIAAEVEPYVTWDLGGWPPENAAQAALNKGETTVKKSSSPGHLNIDNNKTICGFLLMLSVILEFDVTVQIPIVRNRAFFRYVQRRRLTLEVFHNRYSYGLFRRPLSLGKILIPMDQLLNKASISGIFDLIDGSRRKTGGKLEVQVNLREPLTGEDIVRRSERWLVIDEFGKNTGEILAAAGLGSGTHMTISSPSKTNPESAPSTASGAASGTATPSTPTTTTNAGTSSPLSSIGKNPSPSNPVSPPAAESKENKELEEAEEELNSSDSIISNMVLDYEINIANNALSSGKQVDAATKEELMDRKQALEIKMNMLVIQVQTGVLDMGMYLSNVRKRMERDRQLALVFKKHHRLDLAKVALARKKIMQDEIDEATAAMAEQQASEEAG